MGFHPTIAVTTLLIFLSLSLASCAVSQDIDTSTPQGVLQQAERLRAQGRYEEALTSLRNVKVKNPYSDIATEADLHIADIHFEKKAWVEAESAYKLFKELHPRHKRIDYVTFRVAMSLVKQLPDFVDRDFHLAQRALLYFDEVIRSYPQSDYHNSSKEHKRLLKKWIAKKHLYIADFYFHRKMFKSAHGRYARIVREYPSLGYNRRALYGATISAYRDKDLIQSKSYLERLGKEFPKSNEFTKAKEVTKQ